MNINLVILQQLLENLQIHLYVLLQHLLENLNLFLYEKSEH
jgi:hypothetical protein